VNLFGRPKTIDLADTTYEGVSGAAARADHRHGMSPALLALLARIGVSSAGTSTSTTVTNRVSQSEIFSFFVTDTLTVQVGLAPWVIQHDCQIVGVSADLGIAPTGASVITDLLVHHGGGAATGVSVFTTVPSPAVPIGALTSGQIRPDTRTLLKGDVLTGSILQIGSTVPGSWLTLSVEVQR
jgi:hypothetical protein